MFTEISLLAVAMPIALLVNALVLRLVASSQPQTPSSAWRRSVLFFLSYFFLGLGFLSLLLVVAVSGLLGGIMLLVLLMATARFVDVELKLASKCRSAQQIEFLWILATTVRSGGSLADNLELYAGGTWGLRHRRLLRLADRIRDGIPPSEIVVPQGLMSRSSAIEVHAGLMSGRLYEALRSAATRQTRELIDDSVSSKVQMALMYPLVIVMACNLIVGYVMYYIIPKFKKIFDDFGTELPTWLKWLIMISDAVVNYFYLLVPLLFVPLLGVVFLGIVEFYGWRVVSRTILGFWFARPHAADLLRSLAQSVSSERPLHQSLEGLTSANAPRLLQRCVSSMRSAMLQGEPAWQQFQRQGILRPCEVVLLESAEKVGNLPWTLNAIANSIERRWSYRIRAILEFFEPMVTLMVSMVVAFIVISLFLPLVKLLTDLS